MLIGSSGHLETPLSADECAERLRSNLRRFSLGSHADQTHFGLAKRGRTMIRIVGGVRASDAGCAVDYRIEFKPAALVALGISVVAWIPIFIAWSLLGYHVLPILLLLIALTLFAGAANFWISELQATWLRDYLVSTLEARTVN